MKISKHFTTSPLTAGLSIALLGSVWLYGAWSGLDFRILNTMVGLLFFYWVLASDHKVWFWIGFFTGVLWFGWIAVSFVYYHMVWAIPFVLIGVGLIYGGVFWLIAKGALSVERLVLRHFSFFGALSCAPCKALGLLGVSYLHPLTFDWFKPELLLVHSYLGVNKWQFAIMLSAIVLAQWRRNLLYLGLLMLAYSPGQVRILGTDPTHSVKLIATHTSIADKWDPEKIPRHTRAALSSIDKAIDEHFRIVVLPESVLPFFLNRHPDTLGELLHRSHRITILIGALYYDQGIHRNATYLFQNGRYTIANKVLLVPFGEANPLPEWAGTWVNKVFFDGSVDYSASADPTDWEINGTTYRNAICYEATSERLYEGHPNNMIAISNNGWFTPSIEPIFQRLLLEYYVRKYGTTIYHATNMSPSYIIKAIP
jgi:apolipoprotein N-acyltransferase